MAPKKIRWREKYYVVGFHYEEKRLVLNVTPDNSELRQIITQRIANNTLQFSNGFECLELKD